MLNSLKKPFSLFSSKTSWVKGNIQGYNYCLKAYEQPSEMGINGGKISKMEIWENGDLLVNYDRGWDLQPDTKKLARIDNKFVAKVDSSPKGFGGCKLQSPLVGLKLQRVYSAKRIESKNGPRKMLYLYPGRER